ncbi:MAG: hypothetical protein FJ086_15070 [Deltaproteobacteria bacterium]|nr:hypothetical protein [Deltaproteobacteria bacterium]
MRPGLALASLLLLAPAAGAEPRVPPPAVMKAEAEEFLREFISQLLLGEAGRAAKACAVPFQLEQVRHATRPELLKALSYALRDRPNAPAVLQGLEILSPQEMEEKHGKPPARLKDLPWKRPGTWVGVANLSGRGAVLTVVRTEEEGWQVTGYSD